MHEPFSFVLSEMHSVVTVVKDGALLSEEKTEPCHGLFVTVVGNIFRETTLTEFSKSVNQKLGHQHHCILLFAYFRGCTHSREISKCLRQS